jgi:hypothetical protein
MDGDLKVKDFDLWLWRNNHGKVVASALLVANAQVPEPSLVVMGYSALFLIACSRQHR